MPKISIIIPTYNKNKYLIKCLAGLNKQTFKDFEVLVCDDGGAYRADKIINEYKQHYPIKYFWLKDRGGFCQAQAKNKGWHESKGKYLFFLDCDIILPINGLEILFKWISSSSRRSMSYYVTPKERIHIDPNMPIKIIEDNLNGIENYFVKDKNNHIGKGDLSISTAGMLLKESFNTIGGSDDILFCGIFYEDIELHARLKAFLNIKRKILPFPIYHFNHYQEFNERDLHPRKHIPIAKQMIKEKFELLGFKYEKKYNPEKDYSKHSKKYYTDLLSDRKKIADISKKLKKKADLLIEKHNL